MLPVKLFLVLAISFSIITDANANVDSYRLSKDMNNTPDEVLFFTRAENSKDTFRIRIGNMQLEREKVVFSNLNTDEIRIDTLRFRNDRNRAMQLAIKETPAHITATLSSNKIKRGETGYMTIMYDAGKIKAAGHRQDTICLVSDDSEKKIKMVPVISSIKPRVELKNFPIQSGSLLMTKNRIVFPDILNTGIRTDSIQIYNNGDKPIKVDIQKTAAHLQPIISDNIILPGNIATLKLTYDAAKSNKFGFASGDRIVLKTTDTKEPSKTIFVSANIREDFSVLTPEQRQNAPKISFENTIYDFGTEKSGSIITHSFTFTNTGKSDLMIRNVKAGCGCTATHPGKTVLKPGESSKIETKFNTRNRQGNQNNGITVITNDPESPVVHLRMKGVLEKD